MFRAVRFPIAGLMSAVVVVALGLAALRNASETWAGATFLSTCAVLCLAIVGVVCRGESERAWWLGFALFGWGYLILAFWSSLELPTMALLDALGSRLGVEAQFSGGMRGPAMGRGIQSVVIQFTRGPGFGAPPDLSIQQIAHCLWALLAALLGSLLAATFFGGPTKRAEKLDTQTQPAAESARRWWLWPAVLWLAGCSLISFLGSLASTSAHGFWAGATFLATCNLLVIAVFGAARGDGKRRQVWLGAALFGAAYMTLALGHSLSSVYWPHLPTDDLLGAVRPLFPRGLSGYPASPDSVVAANARIMAALEQPVPIRFSDETPLEDVLKYIQSAALAPDGKPIPMYVDPAGLEEAKKTMWSSVAFDLDGVALKTSLRLFLKQLGLVYMVRDGLLLITSAESAVTPVYQDPFLIVGHCLVTLLAAGLGGIAAPLVAGSRRKPAMGAIHGLSPQQISGKADGTTHDCSSSEKNGTPPVETTSA